MKSIDVAVIGGGPAGLHTARLLAEGGMSVAVIEKKAEIGLGVICTGLVGREVFEEFDLPAEMVGREFMEAKVVSTSGRSIFYRHPVPFAAVVDRWRFDRALAARAEKAGAEIVTGTNVLDVQVSREGIAIKTVRDDEVGHLRARLVVLATGIDHRLHSFLGLTAPKRFVFGAQAEIQDKENSMPTIYIGKKTAPGGFAWAVPSGDNRSRIGLLTDDRPQQAFDQFLVHHYPHLDLKRASRPLEIKAIAQGMAGTTVQDRTLSVGEAAGQIKTTTGGGIFYGLWGARLAAEVVLEAAEKGSFEAASLAPYEFRWKAALRKEIFVGFYARKLYSWMNEAQFEALFTLAQTDGLIPLIQKEGHFDWQSGMILSLLRKASVFEIFKGLSRKPAFLDRLLD